MRTTYAIRKSSLAMMLLGAAAIGAAIGSATVATQAHLFGVVRVDRDATGVLSIVNREGSAICLAEDQTGSELCGSVLQQPGSGSLSVGQRVAVTIIWISQTSGASQALVITSPHPGP